MNNTDKSNIKDEISTKATASNSELESISNIYATYLGAMTENSDSNRSSANKIVPSDTMRRQSSSSTDSVLIFSQNDDQIKSLGMKPAKEIVLSSEQSHDSINQLIENDSSIAPVPEVIFYRKVMEQISKKEFNYSFFLNDINGKRNVAPGRKWLVNYSSY